MNHGPSSRLGKAVRITALSTAFALALWLELGIVMSSARVYAAVWERTVFLGALYALVLASCPLLARAFPGRIDQARLTVVVAFGGPVVLWLSVRGLAPSSVLINRPAGWDWWILLPSVAAAGFFLTALCLPRPAPVVRPRQTQ